MVGPLEASAWRELERLGMAHLAHHWRGAGLLRTAQILDLAPDTTPGASYAAVVKDFKQQLAEIAALASPAPEQDDRARDALRLLRGDE